MINLRYHVVSVVAVFLALGIGVVMGSTVIDRVTVDALNSNLNNVRDDVNQTRAENRQLEGLVEEGQAYADQSLTHILRGRLPDVPVLVIAVSGIDREPVDALRQSLVASGARFEGTIWANPKLRLGNDGETQALVEALDAAQAAADQAQAAAPDGADPAQAAPAEPGPAEPVAPAQAAPGEAGAGEASAPEGTEQRSAEEALGRAVGGMAGDPGVIAALVSSGFLAYEPPPEPPTPASTQAPGVGEIPVDGTLFVLVSGEGAEIPDGMFALPLARTLAERGALAVAAEAGDEGGTGSSVFVRPLREDATANGRVSTVDNLESPMGQAAVVLALAEIGEERVGHFGVRQGAQRLLPAVAA